VVPLFVLDDSILSQANGLGVAFMLASLRWLRSWYQDHGGTLVIQHGKSAEILPQVAKTVGADQVVWNRDHSQLSRSRDRAVRQSLTQAGVAYRAVPNENLPGMRSFQTPVIEPETHLAGPAAVDIETTPVPQLSDLTGHSYDSAPLTAGTEAARKRLDALSNGTTYRRCDDTSDVRSGRTAVLNRMRTVSDQS
jgi:hypothetical protein